MNAHHPPVEELGCEPQSAQRQGPCFLFHITLSTRRVAWKWGVLSTWKSFPDRHSTTHFRPVLRATMCGTEAIQGEERKEKVV